MIRHVILWILKEEYSDEEKSEIKQGITEGLEQLADQIPGIVEMKVHTQPLESSNCDVMLDSTFEDEKSLSRYSAHPLHVAVAMGKVRPYVKTRTCIEYVIEGTNDGL